MRMKKLGVISLCLALLVTIFVGCGSTSTSSSNDSNEAKKKIPDLAGEWKQKNNKSDDSYQAATISGDTIEIYWMSDNGDTKSLYWAGSFEAPTTADEPYSWTSKNDHSKTESAMLASNDDTKDMKYEDGVLSYGYYYNNKTRKAKISLYSRFL